MDDILSQIIAYAPNKIDTEVKAKAMVQGPRNMYAGGQLVQPSADGSRPGYAGALRIEPNITKTKAGNYEVIYKNKQIGTFNKISDARDARKTAIAKDPGKLRTEKLFDGKISFNSVVENTMDDLLEEGYESYSTADINKKLSKKIKKDYNVTNSKILNSIKKVRDLNLDKFKNFEFKKGTGLNQVKPLTKTRQKYLIEAFPEINFNFNEGRKYGIDKASNPERWRKIKMFAERGGGKEFPYGYSAKDGLWNSVYRSTIVGDRWKLIGEAPDNWKKDGVWKKTKFKDTKTGDIITYDNLKEYVDSQGGKGTYENSLKSWENKKALSNIKIMYQGKEQSLGGVLNKKALTKMGKEIPSGMKNLPGFGAFQIAHTKGVGNNFWDVEVAYRDANQKLNTLNRSMLADLKNVDNLNEKNKIIKNYSKQIKALPGGASFMFEGQELGKPPTIKSATEAAFKDLGLSRTYKANQKQIQNAMLEFAGTITDKCKIDFNADGGRIGFKTGSADCLRIAREGLEKGLKVGFKKGNQQVLAEGILKSGRFLKDAASLRGLFGPLALGFTVAAEAGLVGYDMLSSGKSFREAVGDSVFNYALGDKTKIDSEEEIIKRLQNIKTGPSGLRDFSDEEIGKMQYFKENLKDLGTGFDLYNQLENIKERQETERGGSQKDLFSENAFQLDAAKDKVQADIQDYNRTNTANRVTDYLLSPDATAGANAAKKASLLIEQDRLQDAGTGNFYQSPKGDEKRLNRLNELKYDIEKMSNPTEIDKFAEYFKSRPQSEQSYMMGLGYKEGGIASLNVNKK